MTLRSMNKTSVFVCALFVVCPLGAFAQSQAPQMPPGHQHGPSEAAMSSRSASGTSWLPDESPMYAVHKPAGEWRLSAHGSLFVQFLEDGGDRGYSQTGSINWLMGMASRPAGTGRLTLRGMVSFEPWTIDGCGYPDLLATGEACAGSKIYDRQHPHDFLMELAVQYERPLGGALRWEIYGGPAGEPALGPVAFPHRISAMPNLLAPISHHWLDATHITFGVVTSGISASRWKAEASVFNGREPDESRAGLDLGPLDSWSGRVWLMPSRRWALQISAGHLTEAEATPGSSTREDLDRITASATYHRPLGTSTLWASTAAWGRNITAHGDASDAALFETSVTFADRDALFGRAEIGSKPAHDLGVDGDSTFTVGKVQIGYTRYLRTWRGWRPGAGAHVSAGIVPASLAPLYGGRATAGFGVFFTLRPS